MESTISQDLNAVFLILIIATTMFILVKKFRRRIHGDDFEYLTVREQLAIANETADVISELEQLQTDVQESHANDVMVLHMEWTGRDNERHAVDLFCDGKNTISECMAEISERQIHDLKNELAYQCAVLSDQARRRHKRRQYVQYAEGEGTVDEAVSALRGAYLDG